MLHPAFRAAGVATAKHQTVTTADPARALAFAAESGYPVSVYPLRHRRSAPQTGDLVGAEALSTALDALAQRGIETVSVEQRPPGERLRCLLQLGKPLMAVRSPADSGSQAPYVHWDLSAMTRRDLEFLARVGRALPGLTVLDLEFTRRAGWRGGYTVVDATVVPRIGRYRAAGRAATRAAVDQIVSYELGVELPDRSAGEITTTVAMATDGPTDEKIGTELIRRLEKAGVRSGWHSDDSGTAWIVAKGEADDVATACVEVIAAYANDGPRLTCQPDAIRG
jgi:hypothetical protein